MARDEVIDPIPAKDALTTLLATDALLIAASTLAATIGHAPPPGSPKTETPARVAAAIAVLMTVVSVGGFAAWWDLYISEDGFDNAASFFEGGALLAALVAIPVIGFMSARWAK